MAARRNDDHRRATSGSPAHTARLRLAGLLAAAGPDAPTLCAGWTTRDLAAHLVARDSHLGAQLGLAVPALAPVGERVRRRLAAGDYAELVARFRSGPSGLSPFRIPGVEDLANLLEFFVHAEDVARADAGLTRADPAAEVLAGHETSPGWEAAVWRAFKRAAPALLRSLRTPVVLAVPNGPRHRVTPMRLPTLVRRGKVDAVPGTLLFTGELTELVMFVFGRVDHADVEVSGDPDAVAAFDPELLRGA